MIYKNKDIKANINTDKVEIGDVKANFYTEDVGTASIRIFLNWNNKPINLNTIGLTPKLDLFLADGSIFMDEPLEVVTQEKGLVQYNISDKVIKHVGIVNAKLFLTSDDKKVHVANFSFNILDSGVEGKVQKEINVNLVEDSVRKIVKENAMELLDESFKVEVKTELQNYVYNNAETFKGQKGESLKYSDLTSQQKEDLKSNITDQAVNDFVLKDGTVTTSKLDSNTVSMEKTDFLNTGKNIFRANNVTIGKVVSATTGELSDSQYFVVSDYEPVKPGATYTQNYGEPIAFYDIKRKYISGIAGSGSSNLPRNFTVPSNAYYIRTTTSNVGVSAYNYKGYQIELGTTSTDYEKFYRQIKDLKIEIPNDAIKNDHIQNGTVSLEKLNFTKTSQNIFDKRKAIVGYYVNPTTGALSTNANYYYSDYINVSDETKVTKSTASNLYAFYDANKNFIANTNTNTKTIEVPTKAVYLRITVPKANIESEMLVKGEVLPSKYIPYKLFIPNDYLETVSENTPIPEYYGKQNLKKYIADISKQMNPNATTRAEIAVIGDSWVQGGEFAAGDRLTLPLRNRMKSIYSDGGIGFVSFANNHVGNGSVSITLNGSWTHYDEGLGNIAQSKGIDSAMVESSTVGDTIKVQFYEDTDFYEIHTLNTGKWRYNVDGGEWIEVDASSQEVTTLNYPLGKHIINIEIVSGKVTFVGSYSYKGVKGVVIHKVGNGGLRAGHIASTDRSNWVKQLQRCRANTYAILLGTNDMAQNISLTDFEKDIKEVVSRIKEAKPSSSIILIAPSGNKYDGTRNNTMVDFSNTLLKISKDLEIAHISLYRILGDFKTTNDNGLMYSDGVHPNRDGGYAISNVIYDRLFRI